MYKDYIIDPSKPYPTIDEIFSSFCDVLVHKHGINCTNTNYFNLFVDLSKFIVYRDETRKECYDGFIFDEEKFCSLLNEFKASYKIFPDSMTKIIYVNC